MAKRDRHYIHAVNADGIRKIIPNPNCATNDSDRYARGGYFFDADWYLDHGCMTLEDMFADIETPYNNNTNDIAK